MAWIILIIAGLCECGFAFCMGKMKAAGSPDLYYWVAGFVLFLTASMLLLAKAVQTLPIGTAYPVWTGIGAVGTVLLGIFFPARTRIVLAFVFYMYAYNIRHRIGKGGMKNDMV